MKPKVIITDFLNDDLAPERGIFGDLADVVALQKVVFVMKNGAVFAGP
jgi:hypothetical protein